MALFLLLFVLSIVNLCLGYALAVWLGFGLPNLRDAWTALAVDRTPPKPLAAPSWGGLADEDTPAGPIERTLDLGEQYMEVSI